MRGPPPESAAWTGLHRYWYRTFFRLSRHTPNLSGEAEKAVANQDLYAPPAPQRNRYILPALQNRREIRRFALLAAASQFAAAEDGDRINV